MQEKEKITVLNKLGITNDYHRYIVVDKGDKYEVFKGKSDILGCILPGLGLVDINGDGIKDVTSSGKAMNLLNKKLPSEFKLEIC